MMAADQTDRDALVTITRCRDLYARAGNTQFVAVQHTAMLEIALLRQELERSRQQYRLVEQMALGGRRARVGGGMAR
jgi:hypothetical protein